MVEPLAFLGSTPTQSISGHRTSKRATPLLGLPLSESSRHAPPAKTGPPLLSIARLFTPPPPQPNPPRPIASQLPVNPLPVSLESPTPWGLLSEEQKKQRWEHCTRPMVDDRGDDLVAVEVLSTCQLNDVLTQAELEEIHRSANKVFPPDEQYTIDLCKWLQAAWPELHCQTIAGFLEQLVAMNKKARLSGATRTALAHCVEHFAGQSEICKNLLGLGLQAKASDITYGSRAHDVLDPLGLRSWLLMVIFSHKNGLLWQGLCCKSFVWVCRSISKRCVQAPFGDEGREFVRMGNGFAIRSIFCALFGYLIGLQWIMEQPISSNVVCLPFVAEFMNFCQASAVVTYLGGYGGPSVKPIKLLTTARFALKLRIKKPVGLSKLVRRNKKDPRRVDGLRKELTASAAYPSHFGFAVAQLFRASLD